MYTSKYIFFLTISLIFASCFKSKFPKQPNDFITKEKLIPLLVDLYLADGILTNYKPSPENINKRFYAEDTYDAIFKKHNITRQQLTSTINYYSNIPDQLDIVFEEVVNELSKKEANISKQ